MKKEWLPFRYPFRFFIDYILTPTNIIVRHGGKKEALSGKENIRFSTKYQRPKDNHLLFSVLISHP